MERILIVRLGAMGDILHAIPAVNALHQAQPNTQISWLVERRWKALLPPFVEPIEADTRTWRKSWLSAETRSNLKQVRSHGGHSLAIDLQGSTKSALLARWMRPRFVVGPAEMREWPARFFYDAMIETYRTHVIEQAHEIVDAATDEKLASISRVVCDVFDTPSAEKAVGLQARFAVINPGAGWAAKQWPMPRYAELAQRLTILKLQVLVNTGPGEEGIARAIASVNPAAECVSLPLEGLVALLRRAALFVGGDTGPMHLAAMLGVPTVAIFGPTDPARNGPYYEKTAVVRSPLSQTSYSHTSIPDPGLEAITVGEVMAAVEQVLQ